MLLDIIKWTFRYTHTYTLFVNLLLRHFINVLYNWEIIAPIFARELSTLSICVHTFITIYVISLTDVIFVKRMGHIYIYKKWNKNCDNYFFSFLSRHIYHRHINYKLYIIYYIFFSSQFWDAILLHLQKHIESSFIIRIHQFFFYLFKNLFIFLLKNLLINL